MLAFARQCFCFEVQQLRGSTQCSFEKELLGNRLERSEPTLLLRMGIFSDEREVEQRVGEVLIGHGGVGKHARAWMAFADGAGSLLVGFQAQLLGIPQIGGRRIQFRDERRRVRR
jgi:hypothetical protein